MNLQTLPRGSFPEVGIRDGLYQLFDGRPVVCSRTIPRADVQELLSAEEIEADAWHVRYYQVFGLDGRPQYLILSAASGAYHVCHHVALRTAPPAKQTAQTYPQRPWAPGLPEGLDA